MGGLQKFERKLEEFVSGAFAKAFRSAVQPVEISAALQREADRNTQILSRQRRMAPNNFKVELSTADMGRLAPMDNSLAQELTEQLEDHAANQGIVFPGRISIHFAEREDLATGQFHVRSQAQASVRGSSRPPDTAARRARAYLEINGTRHPLHGTIVVGRGTDADLRINDPGISRRHIEFRAPVVNDGAPIHIDVIDLGSTNGMLVNGQKIARATVGDASTVRIGTTTITIRVVDRGDHG